MIIYIICLSTALHLMVLFGRLITNNYTIVIWCDMHMATLAALYHGSISLCALSYA